MHVRANVRVENAFWHCWRAGISCVGRDGRCRHEQHTCTCFDKPIRNVGDEVAVDIEWEPLLAQGKIVDARVERHDLGGARQLLEVAIEAVGDVVGVAGVARAVCDGERVCQRRLDACVVCVCVCVCEYGWVLHASDSNDVKMMRVRA